MQMTGWIRAGTLLLACAWLSWAGADEVRMRQAMQAYRQGDFAQAARLFADEVRELDRSVGERHPATLRAMNNLAVTYLALGRPAEALPLQEKVLRLRSEVQGERHPATLTAMGNLAVTYRALGRPAEALPLEEKVLRLRSEVLGERHPDTLTAMNNLASTYRALGRPAEALPLEEKVLRLSIEVQGERHPDTLRTMNNLAATYLALARPAEALALQEKVLRQSTEARGERHPETLSAMNNLAATYGALGRPAEALPLQEKVLRLRTEVQGERHPETLTAMNNLALTYRDIGQPQRAAALSSVYVAGAEWQRAQPGLSQENRQSVFEGYARVYRFFAGLHGSLGERDEGFRLSELSKARTLLEGMAGQHAARLGALPQAEQARLEELNRQVGALAQAAAQAGSAQARQNLEAQRNGLVRQYEELQGRLEREYPKYAQLRAVRMVTRAELAGLVPRDGVVLSYLVNTERDVSTVTAFVVDGQGGLQYRDLGRIGHLGETVEAVRLAASHAGGLKEMSAQEGRRLWRLADEGGYRLLPAQAPAPAGAQAVEQIGEVTAYLARRLLEPLAQQLGGARQWIVSPDGALAQLPFELLPYGEKGEPAIAAVDIHYTQSLSVLAQGRARQRQYEGLGSRRALFAMGNPQYEQQQVSRQQRRALAGQAVRTVQQLRELDGMWQNLPGTEREVRAVAALFAGQGVNVQLGERATEHNLQGLSERGELREYRYLLFSTHGYVSAEQPGLSSVVLGLTNRAAGTDGYVTAAEWPGYDLRSDVAVLSACDTGVGRVVTGEGVMGLPYALFVAGNVNTVLTLWPVEDDATAAFVRALFGRLKAGQSPGRALSETKRQFVRSPPKPGYGNPAVWAPFVLVGPG
jgi:CHAT domain-containing protein